MCQLKDQGKFAEPEIRKVLLQTLLALKCLHQNGLHHGDLNCSKIVVSDANQYILTEHSGFSQMMKKIAIKNTD
jgi:serine/threonine protein kinase